MEDNFKRVQQLGDLAKELGVSLPRLGVAWCLKNENVSTVILGASKENQLVETLTAAEVVPMLTTEVMEKIEVILGNKPVHPQY